MEPRLIQQQTQRLILSPQIRQYLRLLQMPLTELEQAIETELSENPLLEEAEKETVTEDGTPAAPEVPVVAHNAEEVKVGENYDRFEEIEEGYQNTYEYPDFSRQNPKDLEERKNFQEGLITRPEGLSDYLLWQMRFLDLTGREKEIAQEIIGNIDEEGYLRATLEEIAQAQSATPEEVSEVLDQIHDLDPPGIGARNLQEALVLQLERKKGEHAALALKMAGEHLPLLEKRDWNALARTLGVNHDDIRKAAAIISSLEPRPGRTFYSDDSIAVTPDATVSINDDEDSEEKYKVEIHDDAVPEIRINPYYRRLLRSKDMDEKAKTFLRDKMQAALNFLKALKLRKSTIGEITEEIVKAQPEFFVKGFSHLRPLRLKDIANALGIHESTVSRAIHGKYIFTPKGLIPYKSFFSTRLDTTDGSIESQKSIMEKIRQVIDKEEPLKPLSDQEIVKILQSENIVIARRTVAKYRELLKILPSHLRRQR